MRERRGPTARRAQTHTQMTHTHIGWYKDRHMPHKIATVTSLPTSSNSKAPPSIPNRHEAARAQEGLKQVSRKQVSLKQVSLKEALNKRRRNKGLSNKRHVKHLTHRYLHGDPGAERTSTDSAFAIDLDLLRHITVSIFGFEDT